MKFNPAGYVTLNLGRRPEGPDEPDDFRAAWHAADARRRISTAISAAPTDVAWDTRQHLHQRRLRQLAGREVRQERQLGEVVGPARHAAAHADENPGTFNTPAQHRRRPAEQRLRRGPRQPPHPGVRPDGNFQRFILLNAPYDKKRHPVLGNLPRRTRPDETQPWTICITQHADAVSLHVGSGARAHLQDDARRKNPRHARRIRARMGNSTGLTASPARRRTTCFVADMNNWRVQKIHCTQSRPDEGTRVLPLQAVGRRRRGARLLDDDRSGADQGSVRGSAGRLGTAARSRGRVWRAAHLRVA